MHPAGAKNEAHGMLGKTLETKPHSTLEVEELDTDACLSISLGGLKIQGFGWEGVAKKKKDTGFSQLARSLIFTN